MGHLRGVACLLIFGFCINFVASSHHIESYGAFGKYHTIYEIESSYIQKHTGNDFSSQDDFIVLNVSSTLYSNGDQINITWTPPSTVCSDDFIGVYSIEIPTSTRKRK